MSQRAPAAPPEIPGLTYITLLGSGGFADVFLYEQQRPRRAVAVKVLAPGVADTDLLRQFNAEADLMAALSSHPAILTIYEVGVTGAGRPFLVMEYCSRPALAARYRTDRIAVADILRIGVRLAGAVETAHRAGIVHRDIKPANILTTDFGHPVLTDFGISVHRSSIGDGNTGELIGMSLPWTAPEVFAERRGGDERSDIYALGATLYTLLAARSPFDRPGGPNSAADLIDRIQHSPVPPLSRPDVPVELERVVLRAMDRNPAARYESALDFGRALQQQELALNLAVTPIDVLDDDPEVTSQDFEGAPQTRVRALTVVHPEAAPAYRRPSAQAPGVTAAGLTDSEPPAPPDRSNLGVLVGAGVAVVVAAVVVVVLLTRGSDSAPGPDSDPQITSAGGPALPELPQAVTQLDGKLEGSAAVFTWKQPDPRPGDQFQWRRTDGNGSSDTLSVTGTSVRIPDGADACIAIAVVRSGQRSPESEACADG